MSTGCSQDITNIHINACLAIIEIGNTAAAQSLTIQKVASLGRLVGDWIVILYGAFEHCILRPFEQPSNLASEGSEEAIDLRFTLVTMAKRTWRHIKGVDLTQRPGIVLDFEIH